MRTEQIQKLLCVLCLGLSVVLTADAMAQNETPNILDRVQNVDNPELGELIRVAIENKSKLHSLDRTETMELIRKVTVSYTQIKLFDQQIAETSRKIKAETGPAEMRYELLMAKTELESKLMTELANLREIMGIIPKHPFEKQPIESLSSWITLRVLDQGVYVSNCLQPFREFWAMRRYKSHGLQSQKEALDYVRELLKDPNNFPIRIDNIYTPEMSNAGKILHNKVVSLIIEANCQMEAEVNLEQIEWIGLGESKFFIRNGTISILHAGGAQIKRPDGGPKPLVTGIVEPNDLDQHIMWRLLFPPNVPLKFLIEYDEASARLSRQTADKVRAIAKDLGIGEVVDVERALVDSVPESAFLGRWQATTKGEFQTIDIQTGGVCAFAISEGSVLRKRGASAIGRWFLTPKEIFMDIKDKREWYNVYRGCLDKKGNLVVDIGEIHVEGRFGALTDRLPMVFKKVY
jgi:hypothetical protein